LSCVTLQVLGLFTVHPYQVATPARRTPPCCTPLAHSFWPLWP